MRRKGGFGRMSERVVDMVISDEAKAAISAVLQDHKMHGVAQVGRAMARANEWDLVLYVDDKNALAESGDRMIDRDGRPTDDPVRGHTADDLDAYDQMDR